jgi:hypothetical protein
MADFISGRWRTVYEGVAGDTLSTGVFVTRERQQLFDAGRFEELAEKFLAPEGHLPTMLSRERYRRSSRAAARERVARELARHSDAPNPIGSFVFWNRTRRATSLAPLSILNTGARVYCPYLWQLARIRNGVAVARLARRSTRSLHGQPACTRLALPSSPPA